MLATRNTLQRHMVLCAVQSLKNHPTADEIYAHVAKLHPTIGRSTVYRNLASLANAGQICRVTHLNAADRFDFKLSPHYHFYCKNCGKVFDAGMEYDKDLLARLSAQDGFCYQAYNITFTGLCKSCAKESS